jgi:hypothetical protein
MKGQVMPGKNEAVGARDLGEPLLGRIGERIAYVCLNKRRTVGVV